MGSNGKKWCCQHHFLPNLSTATICGNLTGRTVLLHYLTLYTYYTLSGFHLELKVWRGRFTHAANCLATPTFVDHTPYYMLVHHSRSSYNRGSGISKFMFILYISQTVQKGVVTCQEKYITQEKKRIHRIIE